MCFDCIRYLRLALGAWALVFILVGSLVVSRALAQANAYDDLADAFSNIRGAVRQIGGPSPARAPAAPPLMNIDLIVPASVGAGQDVATQTTCMVLPPGASSLTVSRRALVPAAGDDRPLSMIARPYASTAHALAEVDDLRGTLTLALPGTGGETCFSFENGVTPERADGVAQAYKYFAQVVAIEAR
jgi:hypothetical protein